MYLEYSTCIFSSNGCGRLNDVNVVVLAIRHYNCGVHVIRMVCVPLCLSLMVLIIWNAPGGLLGVEKPANAFQLSKLRTPCQFSLLNILT